MLHSFGPRQILPLLVSVAIIAFAVHVLHGTLQRIDLVDVIAHLREIPGQQLALGALLVAIVFSAIALYEVIVARFIRAPVSTRRAVLTALIATPIGHAIGLSALSGGALRYRLYSAVGMRPLDVGKMILLAALPYAAGLGLLLGLALVVRAEEAAGILRVQAELARGAGLALLALHGAYIVLIMRRRAPLAFGRFILTLPTPQLTLVQYAIGIVDVCAAAAVLYFLLPDSVELPFLLFVGVYVLGILAGLASSVPAGLGVFESMLLFLLPRVPPDQLLGMVLAYRFLLELVPLAIALALFAAYEVWWRLPPQRRRAAELRAAELAAKLREEQQADERARRRR